MKYVYVNLYAYIHKHINNNSIQILVYIHIHKYTYIYIPITILCGHLAYPPRANGVIVEHTYFHILATVLSFTFIADVVIGCIV